MADNTVLLTLVSVPFLAGLAAVTVSRFRAHKLDQKIADLERQVAAQAPTFREAVVVEPTESVIVSGDMTASKVTNADLTVAGYVATMYPAPGVEGMSTLIERRSAFRAAMKESILKKRFSVVGTGDDLGSATYFVAKFGDSPKPTSIVVPEPETKAAHS